MKRMWAVFAIAIAVGMLIAGCTPANEKPTAKFIPDKNVIFINGAVGFNGSTSKDPDGSISTYYWNFGDNNKQEGGKLKTVTHQYTTVGVFNASLQVKDNSGDKSKAVTAKVIVAPLPIASSLVVASYTNITFSIDTTALAGLITDYTWNFGDMSVPAKGSSVSYYYKRQGSYNASLSILYQGQSATAALNITILNQAPVANISIVDTTAPFYMSKPIKFSGAASTDVDGQVVKWAWQFGDNATDNGTTVIHTYSKPGPFVVTLTVTDNDNATASSTLNLTVQKDLLITNVTWVVYRDDNNISRANVTVKFDNPGDSKNANTVNITVTAFKSDGTAITSGDFQKWRLFDASIASNTQGNTLTVPGLLIDNINPEHTQYHVDISYNGVLVDSGVYQL